MILGCARGVDFPNDWSPPTVSPALSRFKHNWENFIDQVIKEWKTLNIVSALLLSAIMTMFQVNDASVQAVTRPASLISLICAVWSLIYGGVYILRFGTMRSMYKATRWALEAQRSEIYILWNVWVLLALPAVWLAWSMIAFFTAIMSYVWTSGSASDNPQPPSSRVETIPRVIITALFIVGLVYFALVVRTFANYGGMRPQLDLGDNFDGVQSPVQSPAGTTTIPPIPLPHIGSAVQHGVGAMVAATSRAVKKEQTISHGHSPQLDVEKGESQIFEDRAKYPAKL
ncbi:hypothetical protein SCHPADRAFT_827372 [Schizopora paradoxa]|uniref:Uncharacterized protein n=1 Tax=Schizopora paradoxa TaxID=27342 RepID=A0A0H2RWM2_9AGAM|nr:hypothetical protein SCHPADRAFT_827372 [Schizopora paradoxa]